MASLGLGLLSARAATLPALDKASWIWSAESNTVCEIRRVFTLDTTPTNASVLITADNGYELHVNGSLVGSDVGCHSSPVHARIIVALDPGTWVPGGGYKSGGRLSP